MATAGAEKRADVRETASGQERSGEAAVGVDVGGATSGETGTRSRPVVQKTPLETVSASAGGATKDGFMIAIDTSQTSIVDSLVSIAAAEASFVPGRWQRTFRRLGEQEGSMGL
jgi:hypothetical protein